MPLQHGKHVALEPPALLHMAAGRSVGRVLSCGCVGCEGSGAVCRLHALHCQGCYSAAAGLQGVPGCCCVGAPAAHTAELLSRTASAMSAQGAGGSLWVFPHTWPLCVSFRWH